MTQEQRIDEALDKIRLRARGWHMLVEAQQ